MLKLKKFFDIQYRVSVLACAIASAMLGVEFSLTNQSANAQIIELTCLGSQTTTYSPGLRLFPQPISYTATGALTSCISPTDATLQAGTYTINAQVTNTCLLSPTGQAGDLTFTWNNGQSSTVRFTTNVVLTPLATTQVVSTGTVISGLFQGAMATVTVTLVTPTVTQCLSAEGVTTLTGPVTLTFTRL